MIKLFNWTVARLVAAFALALPLAAMAVDYTGTDYEPWSYSAGCVAWRATESLFHVSTVADVNADGTIGDSYDLNSQGHPWQVFARNQSQYTSPGTVLVFDEAGYNNNSDAQFAPLSFGGMWVKVLQAEGVPYSITDTKTDGTDRTVELGAANASTYFKFDESFTFDRNSATKVLGTATVEIADGKTFTINARANKGALVEAGNTLVLTGEGTLAVTGGLTVSGTLDLSAATVPTISGNVTLASGSTVVLPAGTEISSESPFTICSGTLSVPGVNVFVKIGDADAEEMSVTVSGGAITALGEPIYEFTENFPSVVPDGKTYTFIGGATAETAVDAGAVDNYGTLKTKGFINLSLYNDGTFEVVEDAATVSPKGGTQALAGTITIDAGATFSNVSTDALAYDYAVTVNVYGTLAMGGSRWTVGSSNTINLFDGCSVTGSGQQNNGTLDWKENATGTLYVTGDVNLAAPIRIRSGATVNVNVDSTDQEGLTLAGTIGPGSIVKKGAGLLKFTTNPPYAITVENGAFTFDVDATPTITYTAKPGAGTTMSVWYATQPTWKGTVVIDALTAPANIPLASYGNANSRIVLKGTTGSSYLSAGTIASEVVIDGEVEFNNGSSGQTVTFSKLSSTADAVLKLTAWAGCSSATYNLNNLDGFAGTLNVHNAITRSLDLGGGTFTIGFGNIETTGATTPGSKVLNLSETKVANPTGTIAYNTTGSTINGNPANLAITVNGIYVAVASASIGGVTTYYRGLQPAIMAVMNGGTAGDTVTILDDSEGTEIAGFEYNSETKTYTMLPMVAQFTSGALTHKYTTLAAACADAENVDPIPTIVLLVALGEQTLPYGWGYNTPEASETTYGTLTYIPRVAQIVNGDAYVSLADAVAAAGTGATVELLDSVTLGEAVQVASGKSITIDLNDQTVTGPAGGYAFSNAGSITITGGTVTGAGGIAENTASGASVSISGGSYTASGDLFANVEGASIAVSGGTFNKSVDDEYLAEGYEVTDNGDGTYGIREDKGWIYAEEGYWNYTGTWSGVDVDPSAEAVTIETNATYMANRPSDGQFVTVAMTLSFDAENDEDEDLGDVKTAVKIASGETEGSYAFKLYTTNELGRAWETATVGVTALTNVNYTFVFVLDLTNKTYTASIVDGVTTNAMTVGGATNIPFAYQGDVTPVQKIEFIGAGSVTSIEGSYKDAPAPAEEFVNGDEFGAVTLDTAQAAWLNGQNNYAALADKIATMSQDAFNKAYLLNLDITDPAYDGTFTFEVSDIDVGDTTVSVKVTLTRSGEFDGPIIGTLKLTGTDELGNAFEVKDSATITDAHFSAGDGEVTITFPKDANTKFFQPVIE